MNNFHYLKAGLSSQRRALLRLMLEEKRERASRTRLMPCRRESESYPLSFAQERLWFLNQLEPGNPYYNVPSAMRLTGVLNVPDLEQSVREVMNRHEVLRATFPVVEGKPVQQVQSAPPLTLQIIDLHGLPEAVREAVAAEIVAGEGHQPFDLTRGPLLRARLACLGKDKHFFLLTIHHTVSDGWSTEILVEELAAIYRAFSIGVPSPLPPLPLQYVDFAIWQREWLQGENLESQLAYWMRQLGGNLATMELPTDRPRPPVQTYKGATYAFDFPTNLLVPLHALSYQEGVTPFMTLLAAFESLLYRYTGQGDIIVGTPIAGRTREQVENLIGCFANTLVLRTDLSGDPSFRELLRRVRKVSLDAYDHQDLPFEKLVEALRPRRDLSRTPLFQVMFAFQHYQEKPVELPGLHLKFITVETDTSKFDLSIDLIDKGDALSGSIEYSTDLFNPGTISRVAAHFQNLLMAALQSPDRRISTLPLLTESERHFAISLEREIIFDFACLDDR